MKLKDVDFNNLVSKLFSAFLIVTFLELLIIDKMLNKYFVPNLLESNNIVFIPLAILVFAFLILTVVLLRKVNFSPSEEMFLMVLTLCFVAVFVLQFFICDNIYFFTNWDVKSVRHGYMAIVEGNEIGDWYHDYYNRFPNNIPLVYICSVIYKIGEVIFGAQSGYEFLLFVNCLIVNISVYLAVICVYKITKSSLITVIGAIFGISLCALSPWIVIIYSDTFAMIFPVSALCCYLFIKNPYYKYGLISLICALGYCIKPTVLIFLIALGILKGIEFLKNKVKFKRVISLLVCCAMCLCLGLSFNNLSYKKTNFDLDPNVELGATHFLMMGLNEEFEGYYSGYDVSFSINQPDKLTRAAANLKESFERVKELGFFGLIRLFTLKNMIVYNDGTFAWSREGGFYDQIPTAENELQEKMREIYYITDLTPKDTPFKVICQVLWFTLILCMIGCVVKKPKSSVEAVISLSLFGLSVFLILFECRARYLFLYFPLFLVLAMIGLKKVADLFKKEEVEK